ncbi:MAG: penicillin acylase family protein [Ignavibacteriales bacterium]|nr:penicillin acylase family protein [Ignavibacteriales bacterium]
MHFKAKLLLGLSVSAALILVTALILAYTLATRSFPETSGTYTISGISATVEIYRDSYGVPHVFAQSDLDAYFTAGFVQAQDRLWQMELIRRVGMGRLAEILGEPALKTDRLFRTLRIWRQAQRLANALDDETRDALQAYADGVNAYIVEHKGKYPVEFDMLNIEPEPWKVEHSVAISRLMAWELNYARWVDILFGELVERFGARAREIFPTWPEDAPVIVPKELMGKKIAALGKQLLDAEISYRSLFGVPGLQTGSNAWAVSGSKTFSGMPLLANDPHLLLFVPGRWYEIHLSSPAMDVEGASLAGIPFIVAGHNRRIAWGVTNAMVDDEDFYVEDVDSIQHPTRYRFRGGWQPITEEVDTIVVKDGLPVILSVYSTHRGPIVNRIEPAAQLSEFLLSMRWVGHELSNEAKTFLLINRARTWNEFKEGLRHFGTPTQNFVYADADGNIGYYTGGRLPLRKTKGQTLPFPGWTDDYEWQGFVPFEQMPNSFNPPEGFIATANNMIVEDSYPYHLSTHWEPSWRIVRIVELLKSQEKFSPEDFQRFQLDYVSPQARELVPVVLRAYEGREISDNRVQTTLNYFRNWNFEMRAEDVSTTLFQAFFLKVIKNTFQDEMGGQLLSLYDTLASVPMTVITALLKKDSSEWFDNVETPEREMKNDIVRMSLEQAIDELESRLGGEVKEWQWGKLHKVEFVHVFGANSVLRRIFNVGPFPVGGSHSTVNKGDYRLGAPFANTVGPSMRQIYDLGDVNNTRAVTPPGQSGQVFHTNYSDQIPLWLNGIYKTVPMDRARIEREPHSLLILRPTR